MTTTTAKDKGLERRGHRIVVRAEPPASAFTNADCAGARPRRYVRQQRVNYALSMLSDGYTGPLLVDTALRGFDAVLCLRYEQLETPLVGRVARWRTRTVELTRPLRADRAVRLVDAFEHVYLDID